MSLQQYFILFSSVIPFFNCRLFHYPPKEKILNRKDGTITFPGWYWLDNVTMRFDDIKFGYTTGGPNGTGAYMLQALRPDRVGSFEQFTLGSGNCYESLSFLTWYMDKNRPLPPGDLFDPYRERDFQRRKKEKFPRPLYPASIPTPEATLAQQNEREKYWQGRLFGAIGGFVTFGICIWETETLIKGKNYVVYIIFSVRLYFRIHPVHFEYLKTRKTSSPSL